MMSSDKEKIECNKPVSWSVLHDNAMKFRFDNGLTHYDFMSYLIKTSDISGEKSSAINQYTRPSGKYRNPSNCIGSIGLIARKMLSHLYFNRPDIPPLPSQPLVGRERIREFFADNIIFTDAIEFVQIIEISADDVVTFEVSCRRSHDIEQVEQILKSKGLEKFKINALHKQMLL
jgi:hypothetical protein